LKEQNVFYEQGDQRDPDRLELCTNAMQGEWIAISLKGNRFPDSFIGSMASIMRKAENEKEKVLTSEDDTIHTMAVVEAAYKSSMNQTKVEYDKL
jgi:predicted dehydrogenase